MDSVLSLIPGLRWSDGALFLLYTLGLILLPGELWRRLLRWHSDCLFERFAGAGLCGAFGSSLIYYLCMLAEVGDWYLPSLLVLSGLALAVLWRNCSTEPRLNAFTWLGDGIPWLLVVGFAAYYLVRVQLLVELSGEELRLFGAWYSDKLTNLCSCASLLHEAPPSQLRMDGYGFPSHFFPHLFVAAVTKTTGIDYLNVYWFYASALGILLTGAAVVSLSKRFCSKHAVVWIALLLVGIFRFGPEAKPLDLSLAALLLGLICLGRVRLQQSAPSWKWTLLAGGLIGVMPCYEGFTAATAFAGVWLWLGWQTLLGLRSRDWTCYTYEVGLVASVTATAFCLLTLLFWNTGEKQPPEVVWQNTYYQSYEHEWRDLYSEAKTKQTWLHQLAVWNRNKPVDEDSPKPESWQKAIGRVAFYTGFVPYWYLRFLHVGLFGLLALPTLLRKPQSQAIRLAIAVAAVGLLLPAVINWGRQVEGQWWWTPNIYRFTSCGMLLLAVFGAERLWAAMRSCWELRNAIPLAVALYMVAFAAWHELGLEPIATYHRVPLSRLEALAFLREEVPHGEVVLHPWRHDPIYHVRHGFSHSYEDHFTLGANFAGQQMYYEGREDHLFINGVIPSEVVMQRKRNRERFYQSSQEQAVQEMLDQGNIAWVVADTKHPAPLHIHRGWTLAFHNEEVLIYRRPVTPGQRQASNDSKSTQR